MSDLSMDPNRSSFEGWSAGAEHQAAGEEEEEEEEEDDDGIYIDRSKCSFFPFC